MLLESREGGAALAITSSDGEDRVREWGHMDEAPEQSRTKGRLSKSLRRTGRITNI